MLYPDRKLHPNLFSYFRRLTFRALIVGLALFGACLAPARAFIGVSVNVGIAPPPLRVYVQPAIPGSGYIWTPGYWAWDPDDQDYYWVPGTWVLAPEIGFLWTPAYWGWGGDRFFFHEGYWGPHIGFYGGINYGFGYFGEGYEGGRWDGGHFFYNRSVTNVNITEIHNVYNTTVIHNDVSRVSYNGGNGGIDRRPSPQEEAAGRDRHVAPVAAQTQHLQEARNNPQQRASVNMGKPAIAATARPGEFKGGAVAAKEAGGTYTPGNRGGNGGRPENNVPRPGNPVHPRDLAPVARPGAPNTGNPKQDQKYQQQQEKMMAKQQQERDKLQQKQEQEHQKLDRQKANDSQRQQVEQRHQQQTQQLQQKHEQQQQHLQQKAQPAPRQSGKR